MDDSGLVDVCLVDGEPPVEPGWHPSPTGATYVHVSPGGQAASVSVQVQGRIEVIQPKAADVRVARLLALGPGLAGLLTLRGQPVLHGNTVRVPGGDVVLTGPGGVGKSTLTAALLQRGAGLVADDLAVLDPTDDGACVRPGFGRVKLWDDAVHHLGIDPNVLPRVHPEHDKRGLTVPVVDAAGPLAAIAVLRRGPIGAERLRGNDALHALLVNPRVPELLDGSAQVGWLSALVRIVRVVPVWRVALPGPLDQLPAVAALVERLPSDG